ncbi:hypothetical protein VTK26DRAFT_8409 [Humicola hyalothermophila]
MKFSSLVLGAAALPGATAWGELGHITIGYIASNFVSPKTQLFLQGLLRNHTADYLAGVATWADSIRSSDLWSFTSDFHFIDAKDSPPSYCGIDYERDCQEDVGCVISALANYTTRLLDPALPARERAVAAKFVVHFVSDMHQPLHTEDMERGGNGINVLFDGEAVNLHHVWDSSIPDKMAGGAALSQPYAGARRWADELTHEIRAGKFADDSADWLRAANLSDPLATALAWAGETNAYICTTVLPQGKDAIVGQELGGEYYEAAVPVIESQVAKAGYRLAAWLDLIVADIRCKSRKGDL